MADCSPQGGSDLAVGAPAESGAWPQGLPRMLPALPALPALPGALAARRSILVIQQAVYRDALKHQRASHQFEQGLQGQMRCTLLHMHMLGIMPPPTHHLGGI